jgi:hypothetical protein
VSVWPTATAITYGQTLASSTLSGGVASVDGTFVFTTPSTAPSAGTASQAVTFTPSDTVNYTPLNGTTTVLVNQATPVVSVWPTATAITYGQTLASSTLSGGVASVNGSFAFTAPSTAPSVGTASQAVIFSPVDAANYANVSGTVSVTVNVQATAYDIWAAAMGLDDSDAAHSKAKSADPDSDGHNNLYEFAFDGNPLSAAVDGKIVGKLANEGSDRVLTLTLPVRKGAVFSGTSALVSAVIDDIDYRIEGSKDLASFDQTVIELSGNDASALQSGLPVLGNDWTYRSFRIEGSTATVPKAFMRAVIREAGQ